MLSRLVRAAPALVAASFVLTVFADSGYTLDSLPRPLGIAVLLVIALQFIVAVLARSLTIGSVVATLAMATVIDWRFSALGVAALAVLAFARVMNRRLAWESAAVVPVILFAISSGRAVMSEAFVPADLFPGNTIGAEPAAAQADRPNIYVMLLDGYPRADTLQAAGFDNQPFLDELRDRGFNVASRSHGNYPFTSQVVTSMLQMKHLPEIDGFSQPPPTSTGQMRAITDAIRSSPGIATLDRYGYRTLSAGLPGDPTTLRGVDEYLDPGMLTVFEHQVLRRSILWGFLEEPWVLPQLQVQVKQTFGIVADVASTHGDGPLFLFAHVMSPHAPFVFDREGQIPALSCEPDCERWTIFAGAMPIPDDEYWARYTDQVSYINGLALDAVDAIVAADPDAVVVLLSDHGARSGPHELEEWYRTFFAARTPGHDGLFGDEARSIEVLPRLLNAYLGESVAIAPDITYRYRDNPTAGLQHQLEVVEVNVTSSSR
jgi:hypothetical protein